MIPRTAIRLPHFTSREWLAVFFIFFLFIQVQVLDAANQSTLLVYHLLLPVCLLAFPSRTWKRKELVPYFLFFTVACGTSLFAGLQFGFSIRFVLIIFAFASFMVGIGFATRIAQQRLVILLKVVFSWVFFVVLLRTLVFSPYYFHALISDPRVLRKAWITASGGWNLESTHLAFIAIFTAGTGMAFLALTFSLAFGLLYRSRTGLLLTLMAVVTQILSHRRSRTFYLWVLPTIVLVCVLCSYIAFFGVERTPLVRFTAINAELSYADKGIGRLGLFEAGAEMVKKRPFGVGIGNAIPLLERSGYRFKENNLHNIYLSYLVEGGIQTFLAFFIVFVRLISLLIKTRFGNPYGRVAGAYLFAGLFQFLGYDVIGWTFIGLFEGSLIAEKLNKGRNSDFCSNISVAKGELPPGQPRF